MTIATDSRRRPQFTIGDRLRKARTMMGAEMDVRAFAQLIDVSKGTVTRYELEQTAPDNMKHLVLKEWALATGVELEWLLNGEGPSGDGGSEQRTTD